MTRERLIDLLAMSRFANLPTVWSNALLGTLVAWMSLKEVSPPPFALIVLSLSALYLGGCFLNDWHDAEFDEKNRPERAIPSGRWKRSTIGNLAFFLLGTGLIAAAFTSLPFALFALGIILCIVAYTKWHKIHTSSFFFMAGARALIYPACFFSFLSWEQFTQFDPRQILGLLLLSLSLGGYILGISLMAKSESAKVPPTIQQQFLPLMCLTSPAFLVSGLLMLVIPAAAILPLALFLGVMIFSVRRLRSTKDIGKFVSRTLAAIPLVDFLAVGTIAIIGISSGKNEFGPLIIICPALAVLALLLQRIAPAT
ncbi:MAG: UbiA family prenyltransferase [Verrucomicrobiaceae bacterium]